MKRILGLLLVLFMSISIFGSLGPVFAEPVLDQMGNDPWLSMFHDAGNTCLSGSNMKMPLEEGFILERESSAGFFPSQPAVYDDIMYATVVTDGRARKASVVAYGISNGDPEEIWRTDLDGIMRATPTLDPSNNRLFVATTTGFGEKSASTSTTIFCLSLEDGSEIWNASVNGASFNSVAYGDGKVCISTMWIKKENNKFQTIEMDFADDEGAFYCLDAESGEQLWEAVLDGGTSLISTAAIVNGMVFVTHGNMWYSSKTNALFPAFKNSGLYAFDVESGTLLWKYSSGEGTGMIGSPSVEENNVYVVMSYGSYTTPIVNTLTCLDTETGTENWNYEASVFSVNATPIISSESILFTTNDGSINCVNKETGKKQWSKKVSDVSVNFIDIEYHAVGSQGYIFTEGPNVDSSNRLTGFRMQAFDLAAKGKSVWKQDAEAEISVGISVYGKNLFFCGQLNIFNFQTQSPELTVSPDKVELGKVERSTKKEIKLAVKNKGIPGLEGKVETSDTWIKLSGSIINDDTKEIVATIDTTGLEIKEYTGKIVFSSNGGNKTINVTLKIIDTTAPIITWNYENMVKVNEDYYTKDKQLKLKGLTEPTAKITIQGKGAEIDAEGIFEIVVDLVEGKNEISVETADDVPNSSKTTVILYLDTKAPQITLSTENFTLVKEASSYIMGQVDDKDAVVTINDEIVALTPAGSFAKMVVVNRGVNTFTIKAKDKIGNETVKELNIVYPEKKLIVLIVGKKEAEVNGDIVKMDVAPLIIKGSTMVPLRSLGEFIGAKVDYEPKEQKITFTLYGKVIELIIGRTTAKVNGEAVKMTVPPTIVGGRTLVPLRFVSENLGAKVDYEAKSRTITITYPDPEK